MVDLVPRIQKVDDLDINMNISERWMISNNSE